ncbi:MAG: carboxypeptidase-like regulatory domain-containing protein, partial [Bacteroidaceae bacterium]|nr:carboxypeptidase-like regulatory domain-containing protein [Bacteroidaceae bacterium]
AADAWMEFKWRRAEMKPGVNQLTIFTADGHIQAERRFFICPTLTEENNITITIDTDSVLKPCGKVRLHLNTAPHARLSFSAMDAGTLNNGKSGDIRTYMLLGSDIRGFIAHPEYYFEKDDRLHRMAADTLMLVQGWRRYNWEQMTDTHPMEGKRQIIEDQQYVYGRLGDSQLIWLKKHPVDSVQVHVTLWNREQGRSLLGDAITDKFGNYALRINEPVYGDFKMDMKTMIEGKLKTFTIMVDRQFRPSLRTIMKEESKRIPVPEANLFRRKTYEQVADTDPDNSPFRIKVGKRQFVTKTVKVTSRRRYWTDPGIGWFGELNARRYAQIYYDMEEITQDMLDRGEIVPTWQDFLEKVNPSFRVIDHSLIRDDGTLHTGHIPIDDRHSSPLTNIQYNNKNAEVIIGNYSPMEDPIFIDDIKSIYISHNPSSSIYTIWIFPFPTYSTESNKGRRSTWFHGYSIPSTFQMDDYSVLPPMEDFRRTLYWAPNLQTDVTGRTTVEFYNNSSCQQMYISAEGVGEEGGFIAYDNTHDAYKLEEIKEFVTESEKGEKSLPDSIASRSTLHTSHSTLPEDGRGLFQAVVIDKNTRERIPHAHVYVDADNGTMTNLDGQFVINARPIDQLRISFIGYETLVVSASELTLASDSIMPVLALSPAHNMLSEVVVEPVDQIIRRIISNYN